MGDLSLDSLNPFTGFGLVDSVFEHASAKDMQQRGHDFDREMWDKQTAFAVEQFGREKEFEFEKLAKQYGYNRAMQIMQYRLNQKSVIDTPGNLVKGLKAAGLNPILAATGGFRTNAPGVSALPTSTGSAKAAASTPSRGGSPGGARSNVASATLMKSQAGVNAKQQDLLHAQVQKVKAETRKIESEQPKKDFFEFFWKVFSGDINRFDKAFDQWAAKNKEIVDGLIDSLEESYQGLKQDFRKYVLEAPGGKNPISGGSGRKNRRGK
jgi:hypothetical protein